jgi:hypothetical protein
MSLGAQPNLRTRPDACVESRRVEWLISHSLEHLFNAEAFLFAYLSNQSSNARHFSYRPTVSAVVELLYRHA